MSVRRRFRCRRSSRPASFSSLTAFIYFHILDYFMAKKRFVSGYVNHAALIKSSMSFSNLHYDGDKDYYRLWPTPRLYHSRCELHAGHLCAMVVLISDFTPFNHH